MGTIETIEQRTAQAAYRKIRAHIYREYPYLDGVLAGLEPVFAKIQTGQTFSSGRTVLLSTDGDRIYADTARWIEKSSQEEKMVEYEILHLLLHLVYMHIFRDSQEDRASYDIACDIFVYRILKEQYTLEPETNAFREQCLSFFKDKTSVPQILRTLTEEDFPYSMEQLSEEFTVDDHSRWIKTESVGAQGLRAKWEKIRAYTSGGPGQASRTAGSSAGYDTEYIHIKKEPKHNYHSFLKQFTETREEVVLDQDSFDYIYYNYGMENFRDMPFIEPLEYREVQRLYELVIAIDTSGSCKRETVERFLQETYGIFADEENFFSKVCVYLMQCDCAIQDMQLITSVEEWKKASGTVKIVGRGGTDFTPVFRRIEELTGEKKLKNLKALIYFSDGDGVFPETKPAYETAFVSDKEFTARIPDWIRTYQI